MARHWVGFLCKKTLRCHMTQSTILAAGISAAPSTDVAVAAGAMVTVGIFSADAGSLSPGNDFSIVQVTPGAENYVGALNNSYRATQLSGPGTFRINRPALAGTAFGVFLEV
jgi:hypothetical protein